MAADEGLCGVIVDGLGSARDREALAAALEQGACVAFWDSAGGLGQEGVRTVHALLSTSEPGRHRVSVPQGVQRLRSGAHARPPCALDEPPWDPGTLVMLWDDPTRLVDVQLPSVPDRDHETPPDDPSP